MPFIMSVQIMPGAMALTFTFFGPSSLAAVLVMPMTPAFEAE
ncbi:MAG: hypothetical protein BWX45_00854 [Deltaproteobacteria bacterium ADurb.Bin002]|nr:MAG: hypothetical protein BWX45_00854 [Deltaproteobacteria bacterium ADurb.Bin002]